jgi:hypothetical protein
MHEWLLLYPLQYKQDGEELIKEINRVCKIHSDVKILELIFLKFTMNYFMISKYLEYKRIIYAD